MSEHITHTALVDDCVVLVRRSPEFHPAFAAVLGTHADLARLGGITKFGDRHNPRLLAELRETEDFSPGSQAATRLAFVLGWMTHRAADRHFKQVFRQLDGDCALSPRDCSIYHDIAVLRAVYGVECPPFDAHLLEESQLSSPFASLVRSEVQRALIGLHTLVPLQDAGAWIDQMVSLMQPYRCDLARYAEAFHRPDPDKVRRFLSEPKFYDATDPLLVLARAGSAAGPCAVLPAAAETRCQYAGALARALGYVQAASRFFQHDIDAEEFHRLLDIGQPEIPTDQQQFAAEQTHRSAH